MSGGKYANFTHKFVICTRFQHKCVMQIFLLDPCISLCVCTCVRACEVVCVRACVRIYVCKQLTVCVCVCMCACTYACMYIYDNICWRQATFYININNTKSNIFCRMVPAPLCFFFALSCKSLKFNFISFCKYK